MGYSGKLVYYNILFFLRFYVSEQRNVSHTCLFNLYNLVRQLLHDDVYIRSPFIDFCPYTL